MKKIIVEVRGGLVTAVYGNDPLIVVDILDYDVLECCKKDEEFAEFQQKEAEIKGLVEIY